ncbi:hypothetical protein G6F46_015472 [Rhizopus delemar]|nr:hypothetical protein G6F46_015472 [Rhizopus delemar]
MGTRGNGTLANILIGSVANQVLQLAEAPVTLVKCRPDRARCPGPGPNPATVRPCARRAGRCVRARGLRYPGHRRRCAAASARQRPALP